MEVATGLQSLTLSSEIVGPVGIDVEKGVAYVATCGAGTATSTLP